MPSVSPPPTDHYPPTPIRKPSPPRRMGSAVWYKRALIAFIAVGLLYLALFPAQRKSQLLAEYLPSPMKTFMRHSGVSDEAPHPIISLLREADKTWKTMYQRQSTTYDQAVKEYKARYKRDPPPGFDKWHAFAVSRGHKLVDEYDGLMEQLAPFRSLSSSELGKRTNQLGELSGVSLLSITGGKSQIHSRSDRWAPARAISQMIAPFISDLPDMTIAINEKPEGRVLPQRQHGLNQSEGFSDYDPSWKFTDVWSAFRRACPLQSSARRLVESIRAAEVPIRDIDHTHRSIYVNRRKTTTISPPTRELYFKDHLESRLSMCDRPSLHTLHSAFFSDQPSIEYLAPLFSPSKPAGYGDILIPSNHHWHPSSDYTYEHDFRVGRTKTLTDIPWANKTSTLFWRGKLTRGADTPPNRSASYQKQRLVRFVNQVQKGESRSLVTFDPDTGALYVAEGPAEIMNPHMVDVAISCDPQLGECAHLHSLGYRIQKPTPVHAAWKFKYVMDVDEIGFSPKFLVLMESNSAVLKSSIQQEFWHSWVVPWKHFIPVSASYGEIFNILSFFTGFPSLLTRAPDFQQRLLKAPSNVPDLPYMSDGSYFTNDKALEDIAMAGKRWKERHVRKVDMECYMYRLMIEWAAISTGPSAAGSQV